MAIEIIHEVLLTNVGTNKISFRVEEDKVWVTILDSPGELFFTFDKKEWEIIRKFIDTQLLNYTPIQINSKEQLEPTW